MVMSKTTKFWIAVTLQLVILLSLFLFKFAVVTGGTEVTLGIRPVDPRDPLRGDYVTFLYDISSIPSSYFVRIPTNGQIVYVLLKKKGDEWVAQRNIDTRKPNNGDVVFIKARVVKGGNTMENPLDLNMARRGGTSSISLAYGIEEFFIPENSGKRLPAGKAIAKVSIDKEGNAVIKQIYINNKSWP